jgi:GNAT superfamily N-acetyltransferase
MDSSDLLRVYDDQLRGNAEIATASAVERLGPLYLARFGTDGFITYRGADAAEGVALVPDAVAHYRAEPGVGLVEWKTRQHDDAQGLHDALLEEGFVADGPESIMIGEAHLLAVDVPLPEGVTLRRATSEAEIRAMGAMQAEVFGHPLNEERLQQLVDRLASGDGMEHWFAEAGGVVVSAGRLDPVEGTEFAGIWGGSTRPEWRGRGIYRALTAARARSALRLGKRYINSDSTEFSRPILERSGFVKVSTTTPYELTL